MGGYNHSFPKSGRKISLRKGLDTILIKRSALPVVSPKPQSAGRRYGSRGVKTGPHRHGVKPAQMTHQAHGASPIPDTYLPENEPPKKIPVVAAS